MYCTVAQPPIATTATKSDRQDTQIAAQAELEGYLDLQTQAIALEPRRIKTPQRKSDYKNKARLRLKDLKEIAFREYGTSSSAEIKKLLLAIRAKLDLRLTSAWDAIVYELRYELLAARQIASILHPVKADVASSIKVGDRVIWQNAPAYIQSHWAWLVVVEVANNKARLDLWSGEPVPLSELKVA